MNHNLPISVSLMQIIASELNFIQNLFKPQNSDFKILVAESSQKKELIQFLKEQEKGSIIHYFQVLLLVNFLAETSLINLKIRNITNNNSIIRLIWDSALSNEFQLGIFNKNFQDFLKYYQKKVLGLIPRNTINLKSFFLSIKNNFLDCLSILNLSKTQFEKLLSETFSFEQIFSSEQDATSLFIILSALPIDEINALFMHIQSHLPPDLTVISNLGNKINVVTYFQQPSSDINFLMEKIKTYYHLYYNQNQPIIKHITQTTTKTFLAKLLLNQKSKTATFANLQHTLEQQLIPRIFLLSMFLNQVNLLLIPQKTSVN